MNALRKTAKIPEPTINRLPIYSRCLIELMDTDKKMVSSEEIAEISGIKSSQFRKDLSYFGGFGVQGYGYNTKQLFEKISAIMNLQKKHNVVLVGYGNLGAALAHYPGFAKWNFNICEIYDKDPKKIGKTVNNIKVKNISKFPKKSKNLIAIIAVPGKGAQGILDLIVKSGVKAVLNFSGKKLLSKGNEIIRNVDLTHELAILSYYLAENNGVKLT